MSSRNARGVCSARAGLRVSVVLFGSIFAGCVPAWTPTVAPPTSAAFSATTTNPLKLHLRSGEVVIASYWFEDSNARTLRVQGERFAVNRRSLGLVTAPIPMDSIVLVQAYTEGRAYPAGLIMLAVWGGATGVISGICLADPKACFGSCPTFYVEGDTSFIQAEGFSASPLRVLEARDLDHLYFAAAPSGTLVMHMRNEALETHAVRSVQLLVAPRPANGRVFHTPHDELYPAFALTAPSRCQALNQALNGDCTSALTTMDRDEWRSWTDSTDLASRETIELTFDRPDSTAIALSESEVTLGLVLGARHTLVSTYLFYQALAFAGDKAGEALAQLERGIPGQQPPLFDALRRLGTIDVAVSSNGRDWTDAGAIFEAGPLATDPQVLPFRLPAGTGPVHVRLSLTRGYWRLNYAALSLLGARIEPVVLRPTEVSAEGRTVAGSDDVALGALRDSSRVLVTGPGDSYRLTFDLPARLPEHAIAWDVFLESTGWYYEWMRGEWIADEDAIRAAELLNAPHAAFRSLAADYKRREAHNELLFQQSRITRARP